MGFPCSRERSLATSSSRPARMSAALDRIRAREGAGLSCLARQAFSALSSAAATSAGVDHATTPTTSSTLDGLRTSRTSPLEDGLHAPPIQLPFASNVDILSRVAYPVTNRSDQLDSDPHQHRRGGEGAHGQVPPGLRSEEHTSELQ